MNWQQMLASIKHTHTNARALLCIAFWRFGGLDCFILVFDFFFVFHFVIRINKLSSNPKQRQQNVWVWKQSKTVSLNARSEMMKIFMQTQCTTEEFKLKLKFWIDRSIDGLHSYGKTWVCRLKLLFFLQCLSNNGLLFVCPINWACIPFLLRILCFKKKSINQSKLIV